MDNRNNKKLVSKENESILESDAQIIVTIAGDIGISRVN
jgi:hypothetical protein